MRPFTTHIECSGRAFPNVSSVIIRQNTWGCPCEILTLDSIFRSPGFSGCGGTGGVCNRRSYRLRSVTFSLLACAPDFHSIRRERLRAARLASRAATAFFARAILCFDVMLLAAALPPLDPPIAPPSAPCFRNHSRTSAGSFLPIILHLTLGILISSWGY
jgi:hypothetical protein